jgi:alginate O-acetyltransferase complex protein AlgI
VLILLLASIYFYSIASLNATILFLFSIGVNAVISYLVFNGDPKRARFYVTAGVCINLGILIFFKYSKMFATTFIPATFENEPVVNLLMNVPLPIGISFFTFEGISLLVDVFKNRDKPQTWGERNFFKYSLNTGFFISFFPHLIAGPILKANSFLPQIGHKSIREIEWEPAFRYLTLGYFFKMVIADNLKEQTMFLYFPFSGMHPVDLLVMLLGYSFQIFTDFAGYSLIAIGIAKLLGYELIQNFNYPYISQSFSEFWKRWHISLSNWLKEYLYIPLGGNRKGEFRTYLNLFFVMLLGGLWHGATWSYALWGAVNGLALMIERFLGRYIHFSQTTLIKGMKMIIVFMVVSLAWLFFKLPDIQHVFAYYEALSFRYWTVYHPDYKMIYILIYSFPVIFYYVTYLVKEAHPQKRIFKETYSYIIYGFMLFMIVVNSGFTGNFIYFRF